jgi:hypothetical protein
MIPSGLLKWFLDTIGYADREVLTHLDQVTLAFQRPGLFWLGLAAWGPLVWLMRRRQRRQFTSAPGWLINTLTATRAIILGLMLLTLAGPFLKLDQRVEKRPVVAVVLDQSDSMRLPAGPFENATVTGKLAAAAGLIPPPDPDPRPSPVTPSPVTPSPAPAAGSTGSPIAGPPLPTAVAETLRQISRFDLARAIVQQAGPLWTELAQTHDVRFYQSAVNLQPLTLENERPEYPALDESFAVPATHLGDTIGKVLEEAAGRPVAGMVLLSDGQNTGGVSPAEAARSAGLAQAPLYTVPVGPPGRLRDVAVVDLFTSGQVSVGDTAQVSVTIESTGFDGQPVDVQLFDGTTALASRRLVLASGEQQHMELSFEAKEAGLRTLNVVIPVLPEELGPLHANNSDTTQLRVAAGKLKVLLIDGAPRWDFRFLKNALRRDHGLEGRTASEIDVLLDSELARKSAPAGAAGHYPATLDELCEYHTLILGDIAVERLPAGFLSLIREGVEERGLGLIVAAGPRATPHMWSESERELLPVRLAASNNGALAPVYNPYRLAITPEGELHELLRLSPDAGQNRETWERMPPFFWAAPCERASPAASVLAVNGSVENGYGKQPLIAWHFFGTGRVLFVGTDSTWLWRQNTGDRYFYTFWGQAVRFVARREPDEGRRSRLEISPARVQPGEATRLELWGVNAVGEPLTDARVAVQIETPDGTPAQVDLAADSQQPGRYTGRFVPTLAGDYAAIFDPGSGADRAEARIKVLPSTTELRRPNLNRVALAGLATGSGGELLELTQLDRLRELLKGTPGTSQLYREKTLWDNWLMLVLLVGVYSLDVALRRLAGLN